MATLFSISPNAHGGYDVLARDLLDEHDRLAHIEHLFSMGWTEAEVENELRAIEKPRQLNETRTCGLSMCREYVAAHVDPGDLVVDAGRLYVVCRGADA